jgi:hypothetical protein
MTPKEKAQEIYDKIHFALPSYHDEGQQEHAASKECALIAVDEILQAIGYCEDPESNYNVDCYWADVKREIKKI